MSETMTYPRHLGGYSGTLCACQHIRRQHAIVKTKGGSAVMCAACTRIQLGPDAHADHSIAFHEFEEAQA